MRTVHELQQRPCVLCGEPIDYTLRKPNGMSWSLEHIVPLAEGGPLMDPRNADAAHLDHNSAAGAAIGRKRRSLGQPSRNWI